MEAMGEYHESLISSLNFQNSSTSNAIVDRREVVVNCVGSNEYIPGTGARTMTWNISGSGSWLMLQSLRLQFPVENTSLMHSIRFLGPMPSSCIQSLKIDSAGQLIEMVEEYAKVYSAFDSLLPQAARVTAGAQGLPLLNEGKSASVAKGHLRTLVAGNDFNAVGQALYMNSQEAHAQHETDADLKRAVDGSDRYKMLAPGAT